MNNSFEKLFYSMSRSLIYYSYKTFRHKKFQSLQTLRNKKAGKNEYSLKGFDDLNCIFVHIPKTGGVSLNHSLFGNLGGGHRPISRYYQIFSPQEIERYFKFTIVRNPWDRIVSAYFFLKEGGLGDTDKKWFYENLASFENFEAFVLNWVTKENIYTYQHFIPQHFFVTHQGKLAVDKFYKLEHISSAIKDISSKLNVDISLVHKNKTSNRESGYRKHYNSATKKIIAKVYQKDIQLFDYSF